VRARCKTVAIAGIAVIAVAACERGRPVEPERPPAAIGVDGDGGPSTLPANAPALFGFGTPAAEARIARWDIDVKPDGEGLPPGNGSVAKGQAIYQTRCVVCHGPTGVEGPNDRLVGTEPWGDWPTARGVGNYWPYATTLYDYIRKAMPQDRPGSLEADEVYAVIAYLLHMNELVPGDAVMDATSLPAIEMPARTRFVPDDRVGGAEIR
jgi:mono/diheme cytochrome c family protein